MKKQINEMVKGLKADGCIKAVRHDNYELSIEEYVELLASEVKQYGFKNLEEALSTDSDYTLVSLEDLTYKEILEHALKDVSEDIHVKLMDQARHMATYENIFADNQEDWDENSQYLVADLSDVIKAFYSDLVVKHVFGIDPAESDDGTEGFLKRHGIKILG